MSIFSFTKAIRITRTDGVSFGFTALDRDLIIDGLIYKANSAISPETTKKTIDLGADNLKLKSILRDDDITEADIIGEKFKSAKVICAKVNFLSLPNTIEEAPEIFFAGLVGEIMNTDNTYVMEVRNLVSILNQGVSVKASPLCRWAFGGTECFNVGSNTNSLAPLSFSGNVVASSDRKNFNLNFNPTISFKYGQVTFTSGRNQGITAIIEGHTANSPSIELLRSLPFSLQIGDTCTGHAGCAKTETACKNYGNFVNYGGFPYPKSQDSGWMPGTDKIISSPLEK